MHTDVVTTALVTDGRLKLRNTERFARQIAKLRNGEYIARIERCRAIRSLRANAYYWSTVVRMIADDTGHDPQDVHDFLCLKFLTKRLTVVNEATGEIEEHEVPGRSSKLASNDFYEFVEKARLWAGEFLSLTIPDPDPDYWMNREA